MVVGQISSSFDCGEMQFRRVGGYFPEVSRLFERVSWLVEPRAGKFVRRSRLFESCGGYLGGVSCRFTGACGYLSIVRGYWAGARRYFFDPLGSGWE
jgi:hypothetical protein